MSFTSPRRQPRDVGSTVVAPGLILASRYYWPGALCRAPGRDHADAIDAALRRAREVAERERARPLEAEIHEIDAHLARLLGDPAKHGRHLREAHRLYTEMGATGHAEPLARELEQLGAGSSA